MSVITYYLDQEHDGLALCPADDSLVTSNAHLICKPRLRAARVFGAVDRKWVSILIHSLKFSLGVLEKCISSYSSGENLVPCPLVHATS
jgi:hypothetical protein